MPANNPLTQRTSHIPFDQFAPEQIEPAIDSLLALANSQLEEIKAQTAPPSFDNTMLALDDLGLGLDYAMGIVGHLESVATTPAWREAYNMVLPKVTEFRSKLTLDEQLWNTLKTYAKSPQLPSLTPHRKRYLTKTIDAFRRSGAELPKHDKDELAKINTELAKLTTTFSQNTLDATNAFEYVTNNPAELSGLPESALTMGKASAASKGLEGWRFTLQAPSFIAIMTHADNQALREHFYRAYNTRCSEGTLSNRDNLYRILELRARKASLLGKQDFADLILADRMANNGATAAGFVADLQAKIEPHFRKDSQELNIFVRQLGIEPSTLKPWDVAYYVEKMRKAQYDFDEEDLRPYFPLPRVMSGLFTIVERVFGVSVRPNPDLPTWDPQVTAYSAYDAQSEKLLGHFYADLFPRENKRGGAWMNSLVTHAASDPDSVPHVGLIAGNFTPPHGDTPSLLTHDEVNTLFHEFGHLLHLLCNTTELRGQSMSDVAWDFIELPSQIMENWCWDRESLDLFAAHYQTDQRIPEEIFQKMIRARNFRSASFLMRQLGFSTIDLALHRSYNREHDGDVVAYARDTIERFSPLPLPPDYGMILTFTHLFSSPVGYAAAYYSYQWAEVLDADAFSRFQKQGLFNRDAGLDFRNKILSQGDSDDPQALFESFMGRKANPESLLRRAGLLQDETSGKTLSRG